MVITMTVVATTLQWGKERKEKEEENGKVNDFNDNSDNDDDYDDYDNEDNNIDFEGVMTLLKSERVSAWEKRCWYADWIHFSHL